MKTYAYPPDLSGCGYYRCLYVVGVLQAQGHEIAVAHPGGQTGIGGMLDSDGNLSDAWCPEDADVILLYRPCNKKLAQAVPLLRDQGYTVIVDMDDDLAHIHPKNPAFQGLHPATSPDVNWQWAAQACRDASLVTVSTPALVETYGSHGRVRVLRNMVPEALLEHEHVDSDWFGWPGSLHSHPNDLASASTAIQRLVREGHEFRVVGDGVGVAKAVGLPEIAACGVVPFENWSAAVSQIGVGIAPLDNTKFNHSKSWLRGLHMSALGVPWVGSDLPEQSELAMLGAGVIVQRRGWHRALKELLESETMRNELSQAGREAVRDLTYQSKAWLWAEAWESAMNSDRGITV